VYLSSLIARLSWEFSSLSLSLPGKVSPLTKPQRVRKREREKVEKEREREGGKKKEKIVGRRAASYSY